MPKPPPSFAVVTSFLGSPSLVILLKSVLHKTPQVPPPAAKHRLDEAFGSHPRCLPFVCPTPGGPSSHAPAPPQGQLRLLLIRRDYHTHRPRHSLEPHADEGAELDIHLRMCGVMGHVHRLHSLGGHSCHSGTPSCQPRRWPHPWPHLPGRAAPLGSELCHLHPTWGGGAKLPVLPGVQAWAAPSPPRLPGRPARAGDRAQLPVCLTQHQARIHRVEVSFHLPARCLGDRGQCQGQRGRSKVKATGFN